MLVRSELEEFGIEYYFKCRITGSGFIVMENGINKEGKSDERINCFKRW